MFKAGRLVSIATALLAAMGGPARADEAKPPFDVYEYRVLGNSALAAADVERAVYPFLGPGKTLDDVEAARAALEQAYHGHGFGTVFVDIPEQDVADGIVRLRVSEGRLRRTAVTGTRYFSNRQILAKVPAAAEGTVPNLPALQSELASLNAETPDRAVIPVLKAGPAPGTVDLSLKVDDHLPLHAAVEVNNQRTPDTSALRTSLSVSYSNLFGRLDEVGLQYQTAPAHTRDVSVFAATYAARVADDGAKLSLLYVNSDSDVATVGALAVIGKGQIFGMRLIEPLGVHAGATHSVTVGVDYKDFRQNVQVDAGTSLATPIKYLNLSLAYAGGARSEHQTLTVGASANFGSRSLVNQPDAFENKRYLARPNYFYLRADSSWQAALPASFSLLTRLSGQAAFEPIIGNEQYSIAGADGVRGYLEAETLGDQGLKATLQLGAPPLRAGAAVEVDGFAFFDAGRSGSVSTLPNETPTLTLRSWGGGVNFRIGSNLGGNFTWARPVVAGPRTPAGDAKWLFSVRGNL